MCRSVQSFTPASNCILPVNEASGGVFSLETRNYLLAQSKSRKIILISRSSVIDVKSVLGT